MKYFSTWARSSAGVITLAVLIAGITFAILWQMTVGGAVASESEALLNEEDGPFAEEETEPVVPTPMLIVYITGAVQHPNTYTLPEGARVKDLLTAAGGFQDNADVTVINLASRLIDEQHIHIPIRGEGSTTNNSTSSSQSTKMNLNTASAEELDTLPAIGPTIAARIIAYREEHGPFTTLTDLTEIEGIGTALLEKIEPLVTVGT